MRTQLIVLFAFAFLFSCNYKKEQKHRNTDDGDNIIIQIPIILPVSLENRRNEFQENLTAAHKKISEFAKRHGWDSLVVESFMDSVMIFDNKREFDKTLLSTVGMDTSIVFPKTFSAGLENRILLIVSPEIYLENYPIGNEEDYYEKIMIHEIAHRFHIRILNGNEDAMGAVWFYEGFAVYVANQLNNPELNLTNEEMIEIMNDSQRGSYSNYGYIFRYFNEKVPLKDMIEKAKEEDFNKWMISMID